jgi:hypothetical protein
MALSAGGQREQSCSALGAQPGAGAGAVSEGDTGGAARGGGDAAAAAAAAVAECAQAPAAGAAGALWSGLAAATSWRRTLRYWERLQATSASISAQQCFVLNGTLFIGSILLFHGVLAPLLARLGLELARLDGAADAREQQWARVQALVQEASSLIFTMFWLVPYVRACGQGQAVRACQYRPHARSVTDSRSFFFLSYVCLSHAASLARLPSCSRALVPCAPIFGVLLTACI